MHVCALSLSLSLSLPLLSVDLFHSLSSMRGAVPLSLSVCLFLSLSVSPACGAVPHRSSCKPFDFLETFSGTITGQS